MFQIALPDTITLESSVVDKIRRFSQSAYPQEACGLLIGPPQTQNPTTKQPSVCLTRLVMSPNISSNPKTAFEISPRFHIQMQRRLRHTHFNIFGVFHSHPVGQAVLSEADLAYACGSQLIWVISDRKGISIRAFFCDNTHKVHEFSIQVS